MAKLHHYWHIDAFIIFIIIKKYINNASEMEREKNRYIKSIQCHFKFQMAFYNFIWTLYHAHILDNVSFAHNYFIKCIF